MFSCLPVSTNALICESDSVIADAPGILRSTASFEENYAANLDCVRSDLTVLSDENRNKWNVFEIIEQNRFVLSPEAVFSPKSKKDRILTPKSRNALFWPNIEGNKSRKSIFDTPKSNKKSMFFVKKSKKIEVIRKKIE